MDIIDILTKFGATKKLTILSYLWINRKMYPSDLASVMEVARSQISRELKQLEEEGLIIKSKDQGNYVSVMLSSKSIDLWTQLLVILNR